MAAEDAKIGFLPVASPRQTGCQEAIGLASSAGDEAIWGSAMRHCARLAVNGLELSWSVNNILSATVDLEWAQRGKLVLEEDFHGYEREDRHEPQTVTKSVTSFLAGMLALTICGLGCYDGAAERAPVAEAAAGQRGGRLVVALRAEPRTLNPVLAVDRPSLAVIRRTIGDLIHINRHSHETEPGLAESWEVSPDGRVYTVELRRGVSFSDGHPFDADDVVFSLAVLQDEAVGAPQRSLLVVDGRTVVASSGRTPWSSS